MGKAKKLLMCAAVLLVLVVAICPAMTVSAEKAPPCYNHGDMNGDGIVDRQDAIYNLYSILLGTSLYPVNQDRDINGDGVLDRQDAIYLLYASISMFQHQYPLKGQVHNFETSWTWEDETHTAAVSLQCSCGEKTYSQQIVAELTENVPANCTQEGRETYTASVTFEGNVYTESKTYPVPVNGQHSFTDGVCVHCGQPEGPVCRHVVTTKTLVEGLCPDTRLYKVSCECGENVSYILEGMGCTMDEAGQQTLTKKDVLGNPYAVVVGSCTQCGLVTEMHSEHYALDADGCRMWSLQQTDFYKGEALLASVRRETLVREHFPTKDLVSVSLNTESYGICGQTLQQGSCGCGQHTGYYVSESKCQWEIIDSLAGRLRYQCSQCGAIREISQSQEMTSPCHWNITQTDTYLKDGLILYSIRQTYPTTEHGWNVSAQAELLGESCTDGVVVTYTCGDCGEKREQFLQDHTQLLTQTVDVAERGLCFGKLLITGCACGKNAVVEPVYGENTCQWQKTQEGTFTCSQCGAVRTEKTERTQKDENCCYRVMTTVTYLDGQGNVLAYACAMQDGEEHNMQIHQTLLGASCTDGVLMQEHCADCGAVGSSTVTYSHEVKLLSSVDLLEGKCCSKVLKNTYGCACHQEDRTEVVWEQENCLFTASGYSEEYGAQIYSCGSCGLQNINIQQYRETENGQVLVIINMYFLDGREIFRFETVVAGA